jgi:Helix-turn-helix domain
MRLNEAAKHLGVHPDTLGEWCRRGLVPACKIGRAWVFLTDLLNLWAVDPEEFWKAEYRRRENIKRNARNAARREELRPKLAEYFSWHRASKKRRTPAWADRRHIRTIYQMASRVSLCTGIPFHVDHIYPLHGKHVSGLHTGPNLRMIPAVANRLKGAK